MSETSSPIQKDFQQCIDEITYSSMGLDVFPRADWLHWQRWPLGGDRLSHLSRGTIVTVKYLTFFVGVPLIIRFMANGAYLETENLRFLYAIQIYGGLWAGWATATAGAAADALRQTIQTEIAPYISEAAQRRIAEELTRKFGRRQFLVISWSAGLVAALLAGVLIYSKPFEGWGILEIAFWCVGWWILFSTSAGVVYLSRFYLTISQNICPRSEKFLTIAPARSSLIVSLASLGNIVIAFWLGIALSIAMMIPFAATDWMMPVRKFHLGQLELSGHLFVIVEVILTGTFSIGLGSLVFFSNEVHLRRLTRLAAKVTLRSIEGEIAIVTDRLSSFDEAVAKRLHELETIHKSLSQAGYARYLVGGALSFLVPLTPLLTLLFQISGHQGR